MGNKKYAVAICTLLDVELYLKITEGRNWREALRNTFPEYEENVVSSDLEEAQEEAYDQNWLLSIEEIQF